MKFSYEFIKENLRIYNLAKEQLPIISQFENGEITYNAMRSLGLDKFAEFHQFSKDKDIIRAISYKELKEIFVEETTDIRFKTYLKNRTQKQFIKLLTEDGQIFDRLLNGRWLTKPSYGYKLRRGRRSNQKIEAFYKHFDKLINFIISNDIDTYKTTDSLIYSSFESQSFFAQQIKWYTGVILDISVAPEKEIKVTTELMGSLIDFIVDSKLDFRKLNSDFIIETMQSKIRNLMSIPNGTKIKAVQDIVKNGHQYLTKDKFYTVDSSMISSGFVKVLVTDDSSIRNYYEYKYFEDVSVQRDLLLSQLGII
jgi:hypothetical protein